MLVTLTTTIQIVLEIESTEHVVEIEQGYWSWDTMWGLVSTRMCVWCGRCWTKVNKICVPRKPKTDVFGITLVGQGVPHHFAAVFSQCLLMEILLLSPIFCAWRINSVWSKRKNKKRKEGSIFWDDLFSIWRSAACRYKLPASYVWSIFYVHAFISLWNKLIWDIRLGVFKCISTRVIIYFLLEFLVLLSSEFYADLLITN